MGRSEDFASDEKKRTGNADGHSQEAADHHPGKPGRKSVRGGHQKESPALQREAGRFQEALLESEQRLRLLADNLPGVMVYQLMALPDGGRQFTYVSQSVEQLNEVTAEAVLADANVLYGQVLPEYLDTVRKREETALKTMSVLRVEVQSRLPGGRLRWFLYSSTPRPLSDGRIVWDGVQIDITERKETEKELERRVEERTAALTAANTRLRLEIGERRNAEEALRQVQRLYQGVVEDQTEVICRLDPEGRFLFVNETFCRFFGQWKEELLGKTWSPAAHPDDVERVQAELSLISPANPVVLIENRVFAGDGTLRWMQFANRGFFNADGELVEIQCVGRDITRSKHTEELLRQSEARFRALFYQAVDGIVIMSLDGKGLLVNDAFARMHGYDSPSEMESMRLQDLDAPETARLAPERLRRLAGGEFMTFEVEHYRKDGSIFPLEVTCQVIESGGTQYYLGFHHDITKRREAEAALRESEHKYRALFEDSIEGILIIEGLQLVFANAAMLSMLGYDSVEEMAQVPLLNHVAPEYREAIRQRIEDRDSGKTVPRFFDYKVLRKDGTTRDVQTQAAAVVIGDRHMTQTTFRDITDLKRAEEEHRALEAQVQHVQKLESLGLLAGGIAHDFNNILQIILANVNLMQKSVADTDSTQPFITNIKKSITRATSLTRQMLAYAGRRSISLKTLDLGGIVQEIVELVHSLIPKRVMLNMNLAGGIPYIEGDAAQVQQVIMNLVLNASEALDEERGGTVTISTMALYCSEEYLCKNSVLYNAPEGEYVCLEVSDTGCGMDEETVSKLCDPFFTTKFTGRGLGMSAVLGIMRAHKGALMIESAPGRGTTIRVLFPVSANILPEAVEQNGETYGGQNDHIGTVLFVDDEPDMLELGALMLAGMGYTVITAGNGFEALEILKARAPEIDCAILDLSMPRMDGAQTMEALREIAPDLRVILMSGYAEREVRSRFAGRQVSAFLEKPFDLQTLARKLQDIRG